MTEPLVLLHGFGGTHRSWDGVLEHLPPERYRPVITPDLPGHGERGALRPITWQACIESVLADAPAEPFVLCGYSLGGRVAQHVALAAPQRVSRLVLVSTTAGVDDAAERAARDDELAAEVEQMQPDAFADRWQQHAIFEDTPPTALSSWREDLMRNDPADLAAALGALSPGRMTPMWDAIGALEIPLTVVVGERDERYRRFASRYLGAQVVVVPGAGHGLPREAPAAVAAAIAVS